MTPALLGAAVAFTDLRGGAASPATPTWPSLLRLGCR
jgi:hypothetical protein